MPLRLRMLALPTSGGPHGPAAQRGSIDRPLEFPDGTAEIRIGRRPDLELPLPDRALSAMHARLVRVEEGWQIEDLGSTNGTRLDGERLTPNAPRRLTPGAQITLGQVTFVFDGVVAAVLGAEGTATIARRLVGDLFAASPGSATPTLSIVSGVRMRPPLRLEVADRRYVIGRAETCDLQLVSEEVSREHAEIVRLWDQIVIGDLGSKNGVRVNDALLTEKRRLRDGDRVQIGPAHLRLSDPADRYLREFEGQTDAKDESDTETPSATEPLDPAVAPAVAAAAPALAAPAVLIQSPSGGGGGSRTAIIVAAAVLLIVGVVIVALAVGS
ncbi:MAG TPA: FHA domain-containing protein [Polyangia bacterium]|nr:FHA domain-containing protein [Polyangia bacterium]